MSQAIRILLVDDSTSFRKGMQTFLSIQPDIEVVGEAARGQAALEMIERHHPNLVLLDAQMPGMSGMEVTREIKSRWPHIKVILMTMYPDYRKIAIDAGADTFLSKGLPAEHILALVRGVVQT